jgi:tRNA 5-methylaminomethyl-2-thiouridine biosynthesis bifunctional protein
MSVTPAELGCGPTPLAAGVPYSPLYGEPYCAEGDAWARAQHVFLAGNGLPGRWQAQPRFVIVELGFGLGNNFLATWSAWRQDATRCDHLVFISIEKHPLRRADLARAHGLVGDEADLAARLQQAWPPLTPGMHTLHFEEPRSRQRVSLILCLGDVADMLPALVTQVDAFYLDGFSPAKNPQMWDGELLSRLNRLAAPGSTAATWSDAPGVRDALVASGFVIERLPGLGGKPGMVRAVYKPRYTPPKQAGGAWPAPAASTDRHAIVIGAGLAGCATTLALCREGWRVTLIDEREGPARATSGNPGGLYHAIVHGEDGLHARAHRAAALATCRLAAPWVAEGALPGSSQGLLRLDAITSDEEAHALLAHLQLPPDYAQWLSQTKASELAGAPLPTGAWLLQQAGWLSPADYAQRMLSEAQDWAQRHGQALTCLWRQPVATLSRTAEGLWQALGLESQAGESSHAGQMGSNIRQSQMGDADGSVDISASGQPQGARDPGTVLAQASSIVLCNAALANALLQTLPDEARVAPTPMSQTRGQITVLAGHALARNCTPPHMPIAGSGYAIALGPDRLLCGATTQANDFDPDLRKADHIQNLQQAEQLGVLRGRAEALAHNPELQGRVGWRAVTADRLPLIGALPWSAERLSGGAKPRRLDQVRLIPRERGPNGGLYMACGLGSRGITWTGLLAELIAHWVTGTPCPVEADLRDALDPARFLVRSLTRSAHAAQHDDATKSR